MAKRIAFTGKQQVELEEFSPPPVEAGQVAVRALYSLMSTGTENIVFNRWFDPDTNWDRWVQYPFYPGYCLIGEVAETGKDVTGLKVGDRVALRARHASWHVTSAEHCFAAPAEIDPKEATWFGLAKIAFIGARVADYRLGDTVLIVGAGPIGQMSVRWAATTGAAKILAADPWTARLESARRGGATHSIPSKVEECREEVIQALDGRLPRVVLDATGNWEVLPHALRLAADLGRIVILGDTGYPARQCLTSDLITRGLTIAGAHYRLNDAQWNNATIIQLFFELVRSGRFDLRHLITHTFRPEACADAYTLANTRREETLGIVFDWT